MIDTSKLQFLGYSVDIFPGSINVRIPHYYNLNKFMRDNILYNDSSINTFVLIESNNYFFLGTISSESMSIKDTKVLIQDNRKDTETPVLHINVLSEINPVTLCLIKSNQNFPVIHSKVYIANKVLIVNFINGLSKDINILNQKYIDKRNNTKKHNNEQKRINKQYKDSIIRTHDFASLAQDTKIPVNFSLNTLFDKHLGIIGSTGSGKSYTAAKLVWNLAYFNKRIVLLDPTGEYRNLIKKIKSDKMKHYENEMAKKGKIISKEDVKNHINELIPEFIIGKNAQIPYSDLNNNELYKLIRPSKGIQFPKLKDAIAKLKFEMLNSINDSRYYIIALKKIISVTNKDVKRKLIEEFIHSDDIEKLIRDNLSYIDINRMGYFFDKLPKQLHNECKNGYVWNNCAPLADRINSFINNKFFSKYFCDSFINYKSISKSTNELMYDYLTYNKKLKYDILYIDLSKVTVANSISEIIGDYIARKLLVSFVYYKNNDKDPTVLFLDEAHNFIKKDDKYDNYNLHYFDLIAKEGRKYGLFMTLITQSPNDLSRDVLTQFGTFIIHHLGNDVERQKVASALPYNSNLDQYMSSLNTGEAIISSNNMYNPLLVYINKIKDPNYRPKSNTPKF